MRKFKNYKLRTKFIYAFSLVALMALLIGASAIISMWNMSTSDEEMYSDNAAPMADMAGMYDLLSAQRICSNNMVLYLSADPDFSASEAADLYEKEKDFETSLTGFKSSLNEPDEFTVYNEIESLYHGAFAAAKQALRDAYAAGDMDAMIAATKSIDDLGSDISGVMDQSLQLNKGYAADKVAANQNLFRISTIIVCAFLLLSLIIAFFESRFLTKLIGGPLTRILAITKQAGEQGDFRFSEDMVHEVRNDALCKDEIGQMISSFSNMMDAIIIKTQVLDTVAAGDLSVDVPLVSPSDTIGNAVEKMVSNLNEMFSSINTASSQVSSGSNQIAIGAQQLAQATTEQASTVELLSRNIQDISSMTKSNTELAERAALLGNTIKSNAEQGSEQMQRMTQAVREINEASQSISTVIKVIDDIAFQTNILALNAAVEAARAGEAGKGFAVVADEVRNLAGKSAEAAKNTSALIEDSVQKAELGARIAKETSDALTEIVTGINESSQLVTQIAQSSEEQNNAIADVNNGISQVTEVVQQNSATSEESAAASEEMNSQVVVLNDLVNRFQLR